MKPTDLRSMISQLIFARLGSNLHPDIAAEDQERDVQSLLSEYPIGGLVLFNGSLATTPAMLARLQAVSDYPLLIAADIERGTGQQLRGATVFPHAMAFDAPRFGLTETKGAGDETHAAETTEVGNNTHAAEIMVRENIQAAARIIAREALSAGIQISFAPVADVHSNPNNPIISTRAFGKDPSTVGGRVRAYIRGCQDIGLLTTAKHFPGHGDTDTDSHAEVPVLDKSILDLEQTEFPPFIDAISEGVDLIMTAHVAYPAVDPTGEIATASHAILTDLLRNRMAFRGAIISDSLLMAAAGQDVDGSRAAGQDVDGSRAAGQDVDGSRAAEMIRAGVNILLDVADPPALILQIEEEVRAGRLAEHLVYQAFERVWALKTGLLDRFGPEIFSDPGRVVPVGAEERVSNQIFADDIASRACHIRSGSVSNARISRNGLCVVHVCPRPVYSDPAMESVEVIFSESFADLSFINAFPDMFDGPEFSAEILARARQSTGIVVLVTAKPAAWQKFGVTPEQTALIDSVLALHGSVLVFTGSPVEEISEDRAALSFCLYSDTVPSLRALVARLSAIADQTV